MNPAQEMRQAVGLAEKACSKHANIRTLSVALTKFWYRLGRICSKLLQSNEVHRLESFGICTSMQRP